MTEGFEAEPSYLVKHVQNFGTWKLPIEARHEETGFWRQYTRRNVDVLHTLIPKSFK